MSKNKHRSAWLILGIILIAFNLRPALASVGPLISEIRIATGLSNTMLGLLTTLPLICFGMISPVTTVFTRKLGIEGTLLLSMVLVAGGLSFRIPGTPIYLFIGTAVLGIGIALGNVLLPSVVKKDFEAYSGVMTSVYSGMLGVGAAMAAGISLPLAEISALGWEGALGIWALPAVLALLIWWPQIRSNRMTSANRSVRASLKHLGSSYTAWSIALYMGLQSFAFYVVLAWLPDILTSFGIEARQAGWLLSISQLAGVAGSVLIPPLAEKMKNQIAMVVGLSLAEAFSIAGILLEWNEVMLPLVIVLGLSLGGSFGLALLFIVLRTDDPDTTTELSGMSQSVGYLLAAVGPMMMGALFDITRNWTIPLALLLLIVFFKSLFGIHSGKNQKIDRDDQKQD